MEVKPGCYIHLMSEEDDLDYKGFFNFIKSKLRIDENSIELDAQDILDYSPQLHENLLLNPAETLKKLEQELESVILKNKKIRLINFKHNKKRISEIRVEDLNKLFVVKGIIKRITKIIPRVVSITYECPACGGTSTYPQRKKKKVQPSLCSCGNRKNFRQISEEMKNVQELNLEEIPEELEGKQPQQLRVYLEDELTDDTFSKNLQPGKKIEVTGIVKKLPAFMSIKDEDSNISEFMIEANNIISLEEEDITIDEEDEKRIIEISQNNPLEQLSESLVPEVYGNEEIKKAIVLQLVKGVAKEKSDGSLSREDIHILLSGDVGTSKSITLTATQLRTPKAKMIIGTKTSRVGLGAMAVKDELTNTWSLEVGSLVLCSGSTLCLHPESFVWTDDKIMSMEEIWDYGIPTKNPNKKKFFKFIPSYDFYKNKLSNELLYEIIRKPYKGKLINLKLANGLNLLCTPEHKFYSSGTCISQPNFKERPRKIKLAKNLRKNYYLNNFEIPFPKKTLHEKNAYLFGFIYGDGFLDLGGITISQSMNNKYLIDNILKKYPQCKHYIGKEKIKIIKCIRNGKEYALKDKPSRLFFNNKKLLCEYFEKFLHLQNLLKLDEESLCGFLAGLFDADGSINHYKGKVMKLRYTTTNKEKEIQTLMLALKRLGINSIKQKKRGGITEISISLGGDIKTFWKKIGKHSVKLSSKKSPIIHHKVKYGGLRDKYIKILKVEEVNYDGYVYDVNVLNNHNFICNGVLTHNCLDELDKMYKENLSELLEPMSSGSVTINKAGISAQLPARASILASANPIQGNFNLEQPIASQLDLPSPILNRFDLIFIMIDKPDEKFDSESVKHVFNSHIEKKESKIPIDLFKKYISYCRNLNPKLREESLEDIKDFYIKLRKMSDRNGIKGIPINLRNIEGLIRLAEAHAKLRLSEYVEDEDFEVAKKILTFCIKQIVTDETGLIDTSKISEKVPVSKRGKMERLLDLIEELSQENKKVPYYKILEEAKKYDMKIWEVNNFLEQLKKENQIFEPEKGVISLV